MYNASPLLVLFYTACLPPGGSTGSCHMVHWSQKIRRYLCQGRNAGLSAPTESKQHMWSRLYRWQLKSWRLTPRKNIYYTWWPRCCHLVNEIGIITLIYAYYSMLIGWTDYISVYSGYKVASGRLYIIIIVIILSTSRTKHCMPKCL